METYIQILLLFSLMLSLVDPKSNQGWRGIMPLRSTRADVERLLGSGENECKCAYYLDDVNVFFRYSSGNCETQGSAGWNVLPDTVLNIRVVPKPMPRLSDLKIDESKFKKSHTEHLESFIEYVNEEESFSIEVSEGTVRAFIYKPASKDTKLRCPGYQDVSFPSNLSKDLQPSLLEMINDYVKYGRTEQYEKQYELFLPEFAKLMFPAKNKDEFAMWVRRTRAFGEPWIEFKPQSITMIEDKTYGSVYSIYGRAETLVGGKVIKSSQVTRAVIKNGKWYLIDLFRLAPG